MCFRSPPPPPPLPEPEPVAPPPQPTAAEVITGQSRQQRSTATTKPVTGTQRKDIAKKGQRSAPNTTRTAARRGTASLRIPLLSNQTESGNLRTPL